MKKSLLTNLLALALVIISLFLNGIERNLVLNTGLFALSGGVTNWLAITMLFERVPGFYGSGVIPARFEEFKAGIKLLIMEQFFNPENISKFFSQLKDESDNTVSNNINQLTNSVDFNAAFEALVDVIMASSFGSMLSMLGGAEALKPLKEPFVDKMREFMVKVGKDNEVMSQFKESSTEALLNKVEEIVDQRLEELTPKLVKEIIQKMIREHLGWLVIWGGVLGGVIGLAVTLLVPIHKGLF